MKYFLDTEFAEKPGSIKLISIGIVGENGRTFYAENADFDEREANEWVKENVLNKLLWWSKVSPPMTNGFTAEGVDHWRTFGSVDVIKNELLKFFEKWWPSGFWGYYADYDWVIFCWIFGKMIDLPAGFPKYCRDLKQVLDESGKDKLSDPEGEHNALVDAKWNRDLYDLLHGENR